MSDKDSDVNDPAACIVIIAIIFLSAGAGSYFKSASLGCMIFGSLVLLWVIIHSMMSYLNKSSK
ncbi:hypothetical protein EVB61_142 [Rhizobium phage RHph_TM21B]|nr:hypothetical protein EVB61_142 [Rhizobium phage RHph_TM21B]